jgi:hypothetical protein
VGFTTARKVCEVVVAVPIDGEVARQLHVELLAMLKVDVPELMEIVIVAVALLEFDVAFIVTGEGETFSVWARAVSKEPRTAIIAKAAMELNLRKLLKLISTDDLPGR